jgi:internalin A
VEFLGGLEQLLALSLRNAGSIPSLAFVRRLRRLRWLGLGGSTTVVDGDMSPLMTLPELRTLTYTDRRPYRPKLAELEKHIEARHGPDAAAEGAEIWK